MEQKLTEATTTDLTKIIVHKFDVLKGKKAPKGFKYYEAKAVVRGRKCKITELVDVRNFDFDIKELLYKGSLIKMFVDKFKVEGVK